MAGGCISAIVTRCPQRAGKATAGWQGVLALSGVNPNGASVGPEPAVVIRRVRSVLNWVNWSGRNYGKTVARQAGVCPGSSGNVATTAAGLPSVCVTRLQPCKTLWVAARYSAAYRRVTRRNRTKPTAGGKGVKNQPRQACPMLACIPSGNHRTVMGNVGKYVTPVNTEQMPSGTSSKQLLMLGRL